MNREILITGASGLVGEKVGMQLKNYKLLTPTHTEFDITKRDSVERYLDGHPNITDVVHLAAYTDVSKPQSDLEARRLCYLVNATGTLNLINALKDRAPNLAHLIYASTDMIFPGSSDFPGPYDEFAIPIDHPLLNHYGRSKLYAEDLVKERYPNSAIVRFGNPVTSSDRRRDDYLSTFIKNYNKNKFLYPVFADQFITLADIDIIALTIKALIETGKNGVHHVGTEVITPYEIVGPLLHSAGIEYQIQKGSVVAYLESIKDPTRYPIKGGLLSTKNILGVRHPSALQTMEKLHGRK